MSINTYLQTPFSNKTFPECMLPFWGNPLSSRYNSAWIKTLILILIYVFIYVYLCIYCFIYLFYFMYFFIYFLTLFILFITFFFFPFFFFKLIYLSTDGLSNDISMLENIFRRKNLNTDGDQILVTKQDRERIIFINYIWTLFRIYLPFPS